MYVTRTRYLEYAFALEKMVAVVNGGVELFRKKTAVYERFETSLLMPTTPSEVGQPFKGQRCQPVTLCHPGLTYTFNF